MACWSKKFVVVILINNVGRNSKQSLQWNPGTGSGCGVLECTTETCE
jgi:hypothetical protein